MSADITADKVAAYSEALIRDKMQRENLFLPWDATAKPFKKQKDFLSDPHLTKLARCGNRSAKTFSTMRDLAWRITRKHWYIDRWKMDTDAEYMADGGKVFWVVAPTFDFLKNTCWEMYLKRFIPEWYFVDNDFVSGVATRKDKGVEIIDSVTFRNGDKLAFKTYSQDLKTQMGMAVDGVWIDEMPPHLNILVELVTRTLDHDGCFILGFTPVIENEEIKEYVDNHPRMHVYQWGLADNPLYKDNPDRLQRALDEWSHLPEAMKNMRMSGEWYYEAKGERVFENVNPIIVDDFVVPDDWRRMRVADPANHRTGAAFFAEDPSDGQWFCIDAIEIEWKGVLARTEDIEREIDKRAPFSDFRYHVSLYDNAEAWFGAHTEGKQGKWRACVNKKKEMLLLLTRDCIVNGKVKFFKHKASGLIRQIYMYRRREDGSIVKRKDHMVDCLQYFCREIPHFIPDRIVSKPVTNEEIAAAHRKNLQQKWAKIGAGGQSKYTMASRRSNVAALQKRGLR
jgi:phage terminase large subunit-like protein